MTETAYASMNLLHITKSKLSRILYENIADTFNRDKPWHDLTENRD